MPLANIHREEKIQPAARPIPSPLELYKTYANAVLSFSESLENKLKEMLADDVYDYIKSHPLNNESIFTDAEKEDPIYRIRLVFKLFIDAKNLLLTLDQLQNHSLMITAHQSAIGKFFSSTYNLSSINTLLNQANKQYYIFFKTLQHLSLDTFFNKLPSLDTALKSIELDRLLAVIMRIVKTNNFLTSINAYFQSTKNTTNDPLTARLDRLETIVHTLTEQSKISDAADASMKIAARKIKKIAQITRTFSRTNQGFFATLSYAKSLVKQVRTFILHFPQAYSSGQNIIKDNLVDAAHDLNQIFISVFLYIDRIEKYFYIKQGYINYLCNDKLYKLAEQYTHLIRDLGYQFCEEERFPYFHIRRHQYHQLLQDSLFPMRQDLYRQAIHSLRRQKEEWIVREEDVARQNNHNYLVQRNEIISAFINPELEKLKLASTLTDKIKTQLLTELQKYLLNSLSYEQALKKLTMNPKTTKHLHLLWEGQTRKLTNELKYIAINPEARLDCLDIEIEKLKTNRREKLLFRPQFRTSRSEIGVAALSLLKSYLKLKGYRLSNALDLIHAKNSDYYQYLNNSASHILKEIENIDNCLPDHMIGQILVDRHPFTPCPVRLQSVLDEKHVGVLAFNSNRDQHPIQKKINELKIEIIDSWFFINGTKKKKIVLLTRLLEELANPDTTTISAALDKIATDKGLRPHMYLLYEGRTKNIIEELSFAEMSKEDAVRLIRLEIVRLKREREIPLSFFEKSRKKFLERHIRALENFGSRFERYGFEDALRHLNPEDLNILRKYDGELIDKMGKWEMIKQYRSNISP